MKSHIIFLTLFSLISSQMHGMQLVQRFREWFFPVYSARERALSFLMSSHPRLGAESPAQVLSPDVRRYILTLVKYQEELELNLSGNQLQEPYLDINQLQEPYLDINQLQGLYLNINQMRTLPNDVFDGLVNLQRLDINQLQTLPN